MTVHAATKAEQHEQIRVLECNFQDLAKARNFGVSESSGEFIAFIDADDIWGSNWLLEAVKMARNNTEVHVLHPQLNYYFGHATSRDSSFVTKHIDSQSSEFDLFTLAFANYWTSSAFAQKSVFELVPYRPIDLNAKIGFEDWSFNIDCLVAGIHHSYVPKTIHFIRDKPTYRMRTTHSSFGSVRYPVSFLSTLSARRR
jgi:glycosyltransferase involved in cell wall biosynthesis